jgi:hypothetical protein
MKNNYSLFEQYLHRLSVGNPMFNDISFDLEKSLYLAKSSTINPRTIFISGLARSGTTALLNHLVNLGIGHSLTYHDLPFLFMPHVASIMRGKKKVSIPKERAHGDNILINEESPEAIDEIFWKNQLGAKYIRDQQMILHEPSKSDLSEYKKFIQLHLFKAQQSTYLTKNNNSILRLHGFMKQTILDTHFLFAIREPFAHASSLLKQHIRFVDMHQKDAFSRTYFDSLGHHEFGMHLKSFDLKDEALNAELNSLDPLHLDYWLVTWLNYYQYLLAHFSSDWILVDFNDLCRQPNEVMRLLAKKWDLEVQEMNIPAYQAPNYPSDEEVFSESLLIRCQQLYQKLKSLCLAIPSKE